MTALNFPTDPYIGQTYSISGKRWMWDGYSWNSVGEILGYVGSRGYTGSSGYTGSASTEIGYTGSRGLANTNSTISFNSYVFYTDDNTGIFNPGDGEISLVSNSVEKIRIGANVGIGTSSPSTLLDVNGTITTVALTETSSVTLKENIHPLENALESVLLLNSKVYDRKDGSKKNEVGLIAEEVNDIIPDMVAKDENGNPVGIYYTKLTVYLIESIKSLKKEIEELKNGNS